MIEVCSPLQGTVVHVVAAGGMVAPGVELVVIESMKMEHPVRAETAGRVAVVRVEPGALVHPGDVLLTSTSTRASLPTSGGGRVGAAGGHPGRPRRRARTVMSGGSTSGDRRPSSGATARQRTARENIDDLCDRKLRRVRPGPSAARRRGAARRPPVAARRAPLMTVEHGGEVARMPAGCSDSAPPPRRQRRPRARRPEEHVARMHQRAGLHPHHGHPPGGLGPHGCSIFMDSITTSSTPGATIPRPPPRGRPSPVVGSTPRSWGSGGHGSRRSR